GHYGPILADRHYPDLSHTGGCVSFVTWRRPGDTVLWGHPPQNEAAGSVIHQSANGSVRLKEFLCLCPSGVASSSSNPTTSFASFSSAGWGKSDFRRSPSPKTTPCPWSCPGW